MGAFGSAFGVAGLVHRVITTSVCEEDSIWYAGAGGADPVMVLRDQNAVVAPLIEGFSFLAIATSFIGFVLGLSDFFLDALSLSNSNRMPAYALTLIPPYFFALAFPDVFFSALDLVRPTNLRLKRCVLESAFTHASAVSTVHRPHPSVCRTRPLRVAVPR